MTIDTKGLGAGSYPEPPEPKEKCYKFEFDASIKGYGLVYAETEAEARELIATKDYDEIIDTWDFEIDEVTSLKED